MTASKRLVPGRQIRGMRQLESKILDLQSQYQHLLTQRQQDITALIATLDLASLEDALLVGGLLFVKDKVTTQAPIVEDWRNTGDRFLRKQEPKNQRSQTPLSTHKSS